MPEEVCDLYEKMRAMAEQMDGKLREIRRDLHRYPELGWMEMRTSSLIAARLTEMGFDEVLTGEQVCSRDSRMGVPSTEILEEHYQLALSQGADPRFLPDTRDGMTGVVGVLRCGEGPVLAMRFDIDALPIRENDSPEHFPAQAGFRSENDGVMHACGHDGHTAVGLGTAKILSSLRENLRGTVKFIFQPAEEGVRGAKAVVENGHLDDVDYLIGAHMGGDSTITTPSVGVGTNRTLATTKMDVTLHGKAAHAGSEPEKGANAMLAMATAVLNLQAIPRYGKAPTRINIGKVVAGSGRNVICDRAVMELEVRGLTTAANDYMTESARRIIKASAEMHGCTYEIRLMGEAKGDGNTPEFSDRIADICEEKLGLPVTRLPDNPNGSGSEDYSYMSDRVRSHGGQSCYFINLITQAGAAHNSLFDFDEQALGNGVRAFSGIAACLLTEEGRSLTDEKARASEGADL